MEVVRVRTVSDSARFSIVGHRARLSGFSQRVDCQRDNGRLDSESRENSRSERVRDDCRISRRRINAAVKDRECRVLASLKRRLAPLSRNLRRDYDVRLRESREKRERSPRSRKSSTLQHIDLNRWRSYRPRWQLFGQRLLNSFHVTNLIAMGRYLFAYDEGSR
jgi:hypothetical protein